MIYGGLKWGEVMRATLLLLWAEGIQGILLFCSQLVSMNCCDGSWFHRGVAESQFHHIWQADTVQLLLVRSQQLHHGTFCTASSPGTILPAVHPSTPITFYIPDEIFDILSLCLLANKTSDWEILVIGAVAVSDGRHCRLFPHSCRGGWEYF